MPKKKPQDSRRARRLVTVVEGINDALRERYLTTTSLLPHAFIDRLEQARPKIISHWKTEHKPRFRCLHYAIAVRDARHYVDHHRKWDPRPGWRDIVRVRS